MIAYRIADLRHPIFDPTGAMRHGGRWNSIGVRAIYAAETYAGALLEVLVHSNLSQPPKNHRVVRIVVPDRVTVEIGMLKTWSLPAPSEIDGFGRTEPRSLRCRVLSRRDARATSS